MSNYFTAIKTAWLTFPTIALIFTIFFMLNQYHKYGSINKFRTLIIYSFILYLLTIYFLVILPLPAKDEVTKQATNMIRLIPFTFIIDFIKETSFILTDPNTYLKSLTEPCFYIVFFNIIMTIPFGIYLRYYYQLNLKKTILFSFLLSLFFELTQLTGLYFIYPHPYRLFDVDDLILNTLGGVLGYIMANRLIKYLPTRKKIDQESLERGKEVSGLRRITIFIFDLLLYTIIKLLLNSLLNISNKIIFILYYILIPSLFDGKTIGSKFLNVKLAYSNYRLLRISIRALLLYFYYVSLPINFIFMMVHLISTLNLEIIEKTWFALLTTFIIFLFELVNILILIKRKKPNYDPVFKVKYISTIPEKSLNTKKLFQNNLKIKIYRRLKNNKKL